MPELPLQAAPLSGLSYSLAEVRNGTGWPEGARFVLVMSDSWLADLLAESERMKAALGERAEGSR